MGKIREDKPDCNTEQALSFLQLLRPGGPWVLTAIVPDGSTTTITTSDGDEASDFIAEHNTGGSNVYYQINPCRGVLTSKASKQDIEAVEYLHIDCDPADNESPDDCKKRIKARVKQDTKRQPLPVVDSGNGMQLLFKLKQRIEITGPDVIADIEARNVALADAYGAKRGTQNIDRLFRLPSR
jgi:hypothetical protein